MGIDLLARKNLDQLVKYQLLTRDQIECLSKEELVKKYAQLHKLQKEERKAAERED